MNPSQVASNLRRIATFIEKSQSPDRDRVAHDLKGILAAVAKSQAEWEQEFYGQTGPLPEDEKGSQLFWDAFNQLGILDWTPATDFNEVSAALDKIIASDPKMSADPSAIQHAKAQLKQNYDSYKNDYESLYVDGTIGYGKPV